MRFSQVEAIRIPNGYAKKITANGRELWRYGVSDNVFRYVSLGDSIAAGHAIDVNWDTQYGYGSQYGENGNTSTEIVPDSYTDLIRAELEQTYSASRVSAVSFARSGDTVEDLIEKLGHAGVRNAIAEANLVTICIGANDVLGPALGNLEEYINTGNLSTIESVVNGNLATLGNDSAPTSYKRLFDKLTGINPRAKFVFTTIYNPYKYLWIEEGTGGFFAPLLDTIPSMSVGPFDVTGAIRSGLLGSDIVRQLFDRVNGLDDWAERYVTALNNVLRTKINAYGNANVLLADTKAVYDPVPDRAISAPKHYNDLVNVEYTRGYDVSTMDWGRLYEDSGDAGSFWWDLADRYLISGALDIEGLAADLVPQVVEKVITPDIDPHPEVYGHYAMERTFAEALGWHTFTRRTLSFNGNGGSGSMDSVTLVALDNMAAYITLPTIGFSMAGHCFDGWNTATAGNGATYSNGGLIGITSDTTLYAQWSNTCIVTYMHTNHTGGLYGDDNEGHPDCYALYIEGDDGFKPKFDSFESPPISYAVQYGKAIGVGVNDYIGDELLYDNANCGIYLNGKMVCTGYRHAEFSFYLTSHTTIDFRWKISGSLLTANAQSWYDCYITTY